VDVSFRGAAGEEVGLERATGEVAVVVEGKNGSEKG